MHELMEGGLPSEHTCRMMENQNALLGTVGASARSMAHQGTL